MTALLTHNLPMLAGAPNGIKKLRELILELAVRGKLVPQDPSDEPASELLKRIAGEKARLVAEGKIKRGKALAKIGAEEKTFELPEQWAWVRLADLASPQAGFAFKSGGFNTSGLGFPLIRIRDVGQEFSGTFYEGEYRSEFVVEGGDYLISMDGQFRVATWQGDTALLNQRVSRLIFFGNESVRRFIASSLQARLLELQGVKAYTTVDHLSGGQISEAVIALPPLAEQHRIVAKVDELMGLCDQLEARQADADSAHAQLVQALLDSLTQARDAEDFAHSWQRLAEHFHTLFTTESSIDALKQTLLQLAVMGKLVPQDPSDEQASELLQRIAEEKMRLVAAGKLKKQKPLEGISSTETPFEIPSSWAWSKIGVIALSTEYGLSEKTSNLQDGAPVLKMGDIQGGNVLLGGQMKVSKKTEGLPELYLEPEDLLYNRTNSAELVGKTGIFLGQSGEYTFASYLIRIRCSKGLFSPFYLNASMNSPGFRETQIQPYLKQQCGQANVNGTIMKSMMVSVPPLVPLCYK
ncbi:restriction endonuclease subunit S [Xanthomonas oryzae pv. oryzae]|uniref:restriction endonuclease subunit S n=1 Tax=Xanthomonas oryzae TaxID=347 RepID=UPI0023D9438D|nr:restriction endonuclease subunit S [Xanthomonas oryzae]MDI9072282.1 restriction endonuclease subunit S [Xanthomonas oryzae pv. oryzae]MDI9078099.1 restriction endonuclease subunit S [Xanthomonas oryzae pv. oryzae]MDI9105693.1 restriction endonuclease subunit S [Xanthomonas oryzae pv. oryzae]MDI9913243.1 restriction endonuclease subunit S [Xanthomonas oryzae pv. oryzae]WEK97364.1 restriction endonuclease subunit S [Xanthomonas oryzae pv. oryzae]